jgi:divalent metal cation (Fe/Co/Zn/Cd) transporter
MPDNITTAAVVLEPIVALVLLPASGVLTITYGWPWVLVTVALGVAFMLWVVAFRNIAQLAEETHG